MLVPSPSSVNLHLAGRKSPLPLGRPWHASLAQTRLFHRENCEASHTWIRTTVLWLQVILLLAFAHGVAAVELSPAKLQELLGIARGEGVALDVPGSAGRARPVLLERIDIYAPGARVLVADVAGLHEMSRSPRLHFIAIEGGPLALSMDPDAGRVSGAAWVDGEMFALRGDRLASGALRLALSPMPTHAPDGSAIEWSCGGAVKAATSLQDDLSKLFQSLAATSAAEPAGGPSRQAIVAVDTDNEFMLLKFSNDTTAATDYVADLFNLMNGMYEMPAGSGGLDLRLVQGDTILRPSTTSDPYSATDLGDQLNEFGEHWRVTFPSIDRALAMMLSGKSSDPFRASGIAWLILSGNYCTSKGFVFEDKDGNLNTFGHYSANRVFLFNGSTAENDLRVIAHELGHNLGADHTHCTSADGSTFPTATNTMDQCHADESFRGCYSGSVSCPGGPGSIMSYCHFSVPNCGQANLMFHPGHVSFLSGRIAANFPDCITPLEVGTFTLTVSKSGSGSGTVTSDPAGINCGATCTALFDADSSVTLSASPAGGSYFGGWSGSGCSGTGQCAVTMSADRSVSANFGLIPPEPADLIFRSNFESWDPEYCCTAP
jgi:hypothetical protein